MYKNYLPLNKAIRAETNFYHNFQLKYYKILQTYSIITRINKHFSDFISKVTKFA